MPQVVEFDIDFSYDDEIKINVENLKNRAVFLKILEKSKEKDIHKHVNNWEMIGSKVVFFWGTIKYSS